MSLLTVTDSTQRSKISVGKRFVVESQERRSLEFGQAIVEQRVAWMMVVVENELDGVGTGIVSVLR
jgi:hypothetical protein